MTNQELIDNIESSFKKQFPMGYIDIYNKGRSEINLRLNIGLIGDQNDIDHKYRENDPMNHSFDIRQTGDKLEAVLLGGGLYCTSSNPLYAMENVKTKFRKTTGDANKIITTYEKWFKVLKDIVVEQGNNIYNAEMYQKYI